MADVCSTKVEELGKRASGPPLDEQAADSRHSAASGHAVAWSPSLLKIGLEVLLISAGVFLGLMGDQWREHAQQRELADASLRRLRTEILANRKAVAGVKDYHVSTKASLETYFAADPTTRKALDVRVRGLQPVFFERVAWDLALATQSLAYTDPELAFALSRVYSRQQDYGDLTRGMMQAIYVRPPTENAEPFLGAMKEYYGDLVLWEPRLLTLYDELLPQIDRALGNPARPLDRRP